VCKEVFPKKKRKNLSQQTEALQLEQLKELYIKKGDPHEIYDTTGKTIGKGSVGEVFFAKNIKTGQRVAIKKLQTERKGKSRFKLILNEIAMMSQSKHHNIVGYIETYHVNEELWVIMEYMEGGSLYDIIKLFSQGVKLNDSEMSYVTNEVCQALQFIHSLKRIHRDIKVDNILLSVDGEIKLADFGSAVQLTFDRNKRTTLAGTPYYMSPEIIRGEEYDEKIDVWSLGIMVYEMTYGEPPYYALNPAEALQQIEQNGVQGITEGDFSPRAVDFVNNKCLQYDPDERETTTQLLEHEWLINRCDKSTFAQRIKTIKLDLDSPDLGGGCTIL